MFTELIESFDSTLLIPTKDEVDTLIKKLENNEVLTLEDKLVLSKVGFILHIKKEGVKKINESKN